MLLFFGCLKLYHHTPSLGRLALLLFCPLRRRRRRRCCVGVSRCSKDGVYCCRAHRCRRSTLLIYSLGLTTSPLNAYISPGANSSSSRSLALPHVPTPGVSPHAGIPRRTGGTGCARRLPPPPQHSGQSLAPTAGAMVVVAALLAAPPQVNLPRPPGGPSPGSQAVVAGWRPPRRGITAAAGDCAAPPRPLLPVGRPAQAPGSPTCPQSQYPSRAAPQLPGLGHRAVARGLPRHKGGIAAGA